MYTVSYLLTFQQRLAECFRAQLVFDKDHLGLCLYVPYRSNTPHKVPVRIARVGLPRINMDHKPVESNIIYLFGGAL